MKTAKYSRSFPFSLTSCKNTVREVGYLNKIENPDSIQRVIERLPFPLMQTWCDAADDITNNKHREITFADITSLFELKARVSSTWYSEPSTMNAETKERLPMTADPDAATISDTGRRTMKKRRLR